MTLFRATVLDTPAGDLASGVELRAESDAGLWVVAGRIAERGSYADVARRHPDEQVVDLRDGVVLPGFVDTHVHYPQVRVIGALGLSLLEWLEGYALPEESRLRCIDYARTVAAEFVHGLVGAGTTTALVFGSHFARAVDVLLAEVERVGLRVTTGLVVGDRSLPEALLTTPERARDESLALAARWRGRDRIRYAVTPRFSYSATDAMLDACREVLDEVPGAWFTSHVNENPTEVAEVARRFPAARDYVDTYDRHGLVGSTTVLAHDVHPTARELTRLAERGASVAHCPRSNAALGSGPFPLRAHVEHGVRVALGSDIGAGTGFCLLGEALQAYFTQRQLGDSGLALGAADLLHLATRAGALALGLDSDVGDLSEGRHFDAVWVRPAAGEPLDVGLRHAASARDALSKVIALAGPGDLAGVWVAGERIKG